MSDTGYKDDRQQTYVHFILGGMKAFQLMAIFPCFSIIFLDCWFRPIPACLQLRNPYLHLDLDLSHSNQQIMRNSQTEAVATHKMASTALLAHLARGSRPNIGICTILTRPMSWIIYVSGTACLRCGSLPSTTFCFAAPTTQAFRASCPAVSTMSVHIHETIF